ncbi:hypothetical protein BCV70DRAFT_199690 [Testicularia cyperi]|uniref:DUF3533 domain-containing protein n=1 Tax=Testicularia cyperi TaxID=1882483 RepID=A0A317XR94_9BASI|nr:hypothetical protein BCV70DRAFT_199690 [Testicularia cyperi]
MSAAASSAHNPTERPSMSSSSDRSHPGNQTTAVSTSPNKEHQDMESQPTEKGAVSPARQAPRLGQEGFWSPRLATQRREYLKVMVLFTVIICIFIWCAVSIYWGSVWKEIDLSPNLTGWIINRDSGEIGTAIERALLAANNGAKPHITWLSVDPNLYPTQDDLDLQVTNKLSTWVVVDVAEGATAALQSARANGDASWNPRSVVSMTYATARNFQVVPSVVTAPAMQILNTAIVQLGSSLAREYLSSISSNATAIINLSNAPQTIATPIAVLSRDLRPYDVSVAIAVLVVGLIYLCILAFNATMANFASRQPLQPFLRFRSLVAMRILVPICCYIFISLMISLLNVPFKLPFGRTFSYGAGFMIWWSVTFVGMCVLGLVTECFISLAGPKFIGFALLFFIVINVSVANLPIELSPSFYRYGYAMPFYNIRAIYNKVIFDVGERVEILKYMGILWAWLVTIFLTFPIWIWLERRSSQKQHLAQAKKQSPGAAPQQQQQQQQ